MNWRPVASWATLAVRARMLARTRAFFASRDVLEVETPALVSSPVSDVHLANIRAVLATPSGRDLFLHTSPEYHMKRLLAAGAPDIFQICKVFRDGEAGPRHEPEFTMVEWYRRGFSLDQLITETCALIGELAAEAGATLRPAAFFSYRDIFLETAGIDPMATDTGSLEAASRALLGPAFSDDLARSLAGNLTAWLDLLMTHVVEPRLGREDLAVVHSYPAAQAALARIDPEDSRLAERFEVFYRGLEIANGYRELRDAGEQRRRFTMDRAVRARLARPDVSPDEALLEALESGLPDCSGVALGFDRLVMAVLGLGNIREAVSFPALEP